MSRQGIVASLLALSLLAAGCKETCGLGESADYGTGRRGVAAATEEEGPSDSEPEAGDEAAFGTSQHALTPATNEAVLVLAVGCLLYANSGCRDGVDLELKAGQTVEIEEAPCTGRPFPTREEATVTVTHRHDWLHVGWEAGADGVERFTARADADACAEGCPDDTTATIEILWLPVWGSDPFKDTIEYTAYNVSVEEP